MTALSPAQRCLPGASALSRRAIRCRRSHSRVCSATNDKNDVWSFFEGVKKKIEFEMNYENWAPRGARAYRLREIPRDVLLRDEDKVEDSAAQRAEDVNSEAVGRRLAMIEAARESQPGEPLSGQELAALCFQKYGVMHDMAIKEVSFPGLQRVVALNLYTGTLGQRSFPLNEEQYLAKLDAVAFMINSFLCAEFVRTFFRAPVAPRAGLPSRPRVDTAVTLRLNASPTWDNELVESIFESTGLSI